MGDFATADQMDQRTQGQITTASHPFLEAEIAAAERLIRDVCGWHVAPRQEVTLRRRGRDAADLWLPTIGDVQLSAATIDEQVLDVAALHVDPVTGWTGLRGYAWEISYVAGFEEVPEALVSLTLQVAARALGSPLGVVREQAGAVSVTYSQAAFNVAGGAVLLPHEKAQLAPYTIGYLP